MWKKLRVTLEGNRLRVITDDVKGIIEKASEDGEWIKFGYGTQEECLFQRDKLVFEPYGSNTGFWITKDDPIRLGWTGKFPDDNRFTLTINNWLRERIEGINFHKLIKKLLWHLCRDPGEPSPIVNEEKFVYAVIVEDLAKNGRKPNPFHYALLKKYKNDLQIGIEEEVNPMLHIFENCLDNDCQNSDHEEPGTLRHKAKHQERSEVDEIINDVDNISIDKTDQTLKIVNNVRKIEVLPQLFLSKPFEAIKLIMIVTQFDMLFNCNFTNIIERLQSIESSVKDYCREREVQAKFFYHFGEILTKASRFDEAKDKLQEANSILTSVFNSNKRVILDLLSVKILLGRCWFLCLRKNEADLHLEQAQKLIQEYVDLNDNAQEQIHSFQIDALILSAEMSVKRCNYQVAAEESRKALQLLTETKLPRKWNFYILEATCTRLLGDALINLVCLEEAENCFTKALELFETHLDENDHQDIAKCCVRLGDVYCLKKNFPDGIKNLLKALDMRQRIFPNPDSNLEVAASLNRVGYAYHVIGDREKARDYFDKAREVRKTVYKDPIDVSTLYISYPSCSYSDGDMDMASEEYDRWQDQTTKPHLAHASAKHLRGDIWFARADWKKALECYNYALKIRQEFESQWSATAATVYAIGKCLVATNDLEEARNSFLEANMLRQRLLDDDWELDVQLATVCLKQQKFDEAIGHLNAAMDRCKVELSRLKLKDALNKIRTEEMSDEEIHIVVTMIWSTPAEPFLLI